MDLSKVSKGGQIFAASGLVYFIASLLPWYSIPDEFAILGIPTSFNAWGDIGFLWGSLWALLLLAGAVLVALPAFGVKAPKLPEVAFLVVAGLATLFTLLKLLVGESDPISASFGIFLAVIAAGGAAFGAFLMFKESGGDLNDLKDVNKLKSQFGVAGNAGGAAAPPPPPPPPAPGSTPPPPPPPPPPPAP
ncbi:MAG: hypothetical protein RL238_2858 [Actinomycetota bacterium]|jgi:hypothetical protein